MKRIEQQGIPDGFRTPRKWFVTHPETGKLFPAKAVWCLATDVGPYKLGPQVAIRRLRSLGFNLLELASEALAADLALTPEELVAQSAFTEGAVRQITTNRRERSHQARREAEAHYRALNGNRLLCEGCKIDFAHTYGPRGDGFMHFHHIMPLADASGARPVSGAEDLVPLCPNCHAMVHRGEALWTIQDLRQELRLLRSSGV